MRRLLIIAVLVELGLLLIVVPWSTYWERNYFAQISPVVQTIVTNNYVRGAITGLGAVNVLAALADLAALVRRRESGADLPRNFNRAFFRQTADTTQQNREILTVDVLHGEKHLPVQFAHVIHLSLIHI